MKILIAILILMPFTFAHAKDVGYKLDLALTLEGQKVFSPRMIVKESQKASISQKLKNSADEIFIDVVATRDKKEKGIFLKFTVGKTRGSKRVVIAEPRIITLDGEKAEVLQENFSLAVVPKQIDL